MGHLLRWSAMFPRIMEVFPAGDHVVLGLSRGVMAVRARDGAQQWSRMAERTKADQNPHLLTAHETSGTLVLEDTRLADNNYYGNLEALDLNTGRKRYRLDISAGNFDGTYTILQHGSIVLLGVDRTEAPNEIIAVDPGTGKQRWTAAFADRCSPSSEPGLHGSLLYLRTERRELIAIDLRTGRRKTVLTPSLPTRCWDP